MFGEEKIGNKRVWNFPSFVPSKMGELGFRGCRVTINENGSVRVDLSFEESLRNISFRPLWLTANLELRFRTQSRRFLPIGGGTVESTVTLLFKRDRAMIQRLREKASFRLCSRKSDAKLLIAEYELIDQGTPRLPKKEDLF